MSLENSGSSDTLAPYAVGTTLKLLPHNDPAEPYGGPKYGWPSDEKQDQLSKSSIAHPSSYKPRPPGQKIKGEELTVKVLKLTRDSATDAPQGPLLLVCQVVKPPHIHKDNGEQVGKGDTIVAEVFDHKLYNTIALPFAPVMSPVYLADSGFSQLAGIYRRLHQEGKSAADGKVKLTGPSHIAPEYYGNWVIQHFPDNDPGKPPSRYVGAVLREDVQGPSIESVCLRHERDGLLPLRKIRPHDDLDREIHLDKQTRLELMKQIIHGCVVHKRYHVEHEGPEARNYVITLRRNGKILKHPQAVQVNFEYTYLWDLTIWAKSTFPDHKNHLNISKLPHPLHPIELYDWDSLNDFAGWTPWDWSYGAHMREGMSLIHQWFIRPDVFGPKQEGPRYSLFATFDRINEMTALTSSLNLHSTGSQRSVGSEHSRSTGLSVRSRARRGEGSGDTQEDDIPEDDDE
ncbi:hypothetical protein K4K61_001896 [Colletotrichum sp. SAR11_59]|nr:hypothetical protein K4K61_001896 [Colletotrichum sp. SAR11_59]